MQKPHIERPAEIGESFNWRLTDVPGQPVTLREVLGVAHGDHRIINKCEIAFIFDDKGCANDEGQIEDGRDGQQ